MNYYGYEFIRESDLTHHGIKGQKWGVRRWQNEDGSLTDKGKRRYYGAADVIQRDIDSFKGHEGGIKTKSGKMALSSQDVSKIVKSLEEQRDKARAKGDKKRVIDEYKAKPYKEKLKTQNYQRYGSKNLPIVAVGKHYIDNAKYWKQEMPAVKTSDNKVKAFVNVFLDQPMHVSGLTGTSDTTLRKRFTGQFVEAY